MTTAPETFSAQRTLLPYRLAFESARRDILDCASWRDNNADLEAHIEAVFHHGEPGEAPLRRFMERAVGTHEDEAFHLVEKLAEAARLLRLFEREWMFPHGFALVRVPQQQEAA